MAASYEPKSTDLLKKCSCVESEQNISDFPQIKKILPDGYEYTMCVWVQVNEEHYDCRFRINIYTKEDAIEWLKKFQVSSKTIYLKDKEYRADPSTNYLYKIRHRCHLAFRTRATVRKPKHKSTFCPARLVFIVLKTNLPRQPLIPDVHLEEFPMIVTYRCRHNHCTDPDFGVQYRSPAPEVKNMFMNYFKYGLTPTKAFEMYEAHLKETYQEEFPKVIKDGSLYPKNKWVVNFFNYFKKLQRTAGRGEWQVLRESIAEYNSKMKAKCAEFRACFIIIVTPLMRRVLENVKDSSELIFTDSAFANDDHTVRIHLLLTNSCGRDLPVGSIISTHEDESILTAALEQYKTFLNSDCFGGRGALGPKVIMTGKKRYEKNSFSCAFPEATTQKCSFHILQSAWKHVIRSNKNIPLEQRKEIFSRIKNMVNSGSEDELIANYTSIKNSAEASEFPKIMSYVDKMYAEKHDWARCLALKRQYNLKESAIRIIKDNVYKKVRSYSTFELFDFIISDTEKFYATNLLASVSNGCPPEYLKDKVTFDEGELNDFFLTKLDHDQYKVIFSRNRTECIVDMDIGVCTCGHGVNGEICKHQVAVSNQNREELVPVPLDSEEKSLLLFLATGKKDAVNQDLVLEEINEPKLVSVPYDARRKALLFFLPTNKDTSDQGFVTNENSAQKPVSVPHDSQQKAVVLFLPGGENGALKNSPLPQSASNQEKSSDTVSAEEDSSGTPDYEMEEDSCDEVNTTNINFSNYITGQKQVYSQQSITEDYSNCNRVFVSTETKLPSAPHDSPPKTVLLYYVTAKKDVVKHSFSPQSDPNHQQTSGDVLEEAFNVVSECGMEKNNGDETNPVDTNVVSECGMEKNDGYETNPADTNVVSECGMEKNDGDETNPADTNVVVEERQVDKNAVLKDFNDCIKEIADEAERNSEVLGAVEKFVNDYKRIKMEHSLNLARSLAGLLDFNNLFQ